MSKEHQLLFPFATFDLEINVFLNSELVKLLSLLATLHAPLPIWHQKLMNQSPLGVQAKQNIQASD